MTDLTQLVPANDPDYFPPAIYAEVCVMNMTVEKFIDLLRRIEACPDVMFTIDANDSDLAAEIVEILGAEDDS